MRIWIQSNCGDGTRDRLRTTTARVRAFTKLAKSPGRASILIAVLLIGCGLLTVAVRAYNYKVSNQPLTANTSAAAPSAQGNNKSGSSNLARRLALQPEADRFRLKLGQRFLAPGNERATIAGTLTIGAQQFQVRLVRTQSDDGEAVEIALNTGVSSLTSLTWNAGEGARSGASQASGNERQLIERLALDSPDQFIQAQLRMASYYTIARNVLPAGGDADDYNGPAWDVVRVTEPNDDSTGKPLSPVRYYFLNSSTGLLEKVVSDEPGQTIVAELSGWTTQGGELLPAHIVWTRDKQVVMELTVNGFLTGPKA